METAPLRVVLRMETSLLSSALAQVLARDPRLAVEVYAPGGTLDAHTDLVSRRTVEVAVLEDPPRIELHADDQDWILRYRSLPCLAMLLADCQRFDAAYAVRAHCA